MWNKAEGTIYNVDKMVELISSYKDKIEGITFLGGEPLEQIEAVTYISKKVKELGLTVLIFTGYDYHLISTKKEVQELTKHIDILIDGKYDETQQDFSRAWVGSSNQNYYFFSNRYDKSIINKYKNKIEVRIDKNNKISLNGMGNFKELMKAI